ncbi:Energy-coupling factor transporter ATP-binding protein EcfA2 [Variovorax sp. OK605]|jgi:predicted ATPase|nr:Energy-coupling factor transporter ATP-binding protein EcfA2 [Variovorax sp. OK605]
MQSVKIDIHTHTRKCKSGDAQTREISPEDFCDAILSTEVRVVAITNHNVFDLSQFQAIQARIGTDAQVWPGVELDVYDDRGKGHLLVIVSPKLAAQFFAAVVDLTKGYTPDSFKVTIPDVLATFDAMEPLYVAHYKQKRPSVSDEMLAALESGAQNKWSILKEVSNAISAGIHISHGRSSIYGSDIHDWGKYVEGAHELPDLRLPIDGFEHFCLLLQKDPTTINTVMDRKTSEELTLAPFEDGKKLTIRVFNDINIIFGPKGTGKSCILHAIAKHYMKNGIDAKVYESASGRLNDIFDIKGKGLSINLNNHGISYCQDDIQVVLTAIEVDVTSVTKFKAFFESTVSNKNAKLILLKDIDTQEEGDAERNFSKYHETASKIDAFFAFMEEDPLVKKELADDEFTELRRILGLLLDRLIGKEWSGFVDWKELSLLNSAIKTFRIEVERKTGSPAKPTTTGFRDYAMNRLKIAASIRAIDKSLNSVIENEEEIVGDLGSGKGELKFVTQFLFQDGSVTDGETLSLTSVKKGVQKKFVNALHAVGKHVFQDNLFHYVSELNATEGVDEIKTVHELLLFKRYFTLDGLPYAPSSGEASMVMLQKELGIDKEVYILDEPEKSLGNEYINDVIVPLIKERAKSGRKVFISTHDANIAVRTLPYCSIYRTHGPEGYSTFVGNPFTNNLVNVEKPEERDWKMVSMRTLEGGKDAFGERGKIYGHT